MIEYILKSSLCLLVVWGFYKIFLEKENIPGLKRFYLLFCILFSFTTPLITFTYQIEAVLQPEITDVLRPQEMKNSIEYSTVEENKFSLTSILWLIYGFGVFIFGARFITNIHRIINRIKNNDRDKEQTHTNVLLDKKMVPHTFLNYIFVPKEDFRNNLIPDAVLHHEKAHVSQKHTLDILFVELMQVAFWFNPLFIFLKKSIKLNHEFLADQNVLKEKFSIQNYFHILVNYPSSLNQTELSSSINYSLTKKRLQMMTKEFSKKRVVLKLVSFVPIAMVCLLFFNNDIIAKEKKIEFPKTELVSTADELSAINTNLEAKNSKEESKVLKSLNTAYLIQEKIQEKVTEQMLNDYNNWAKKMESDKGMIIKQKDLQRMEAIYALMTSDQKAKAVKFPILPPTPPTPKVLRGEKSNIPTPPAPKVSRRQKNNIPTPPTAPSNTNQERTEIRFSEDIDISDQESAERFNVLLEEKKRLLIDAQELAEEAREQVELQREMVASISEEARTVAEEARELAAFQREMAESLREEARAVAEEARIIAIEASQRTREKYRIRGKKAEKLAKRNRDMAQKGRLIALELAEQSHKKAIEERERIMEYATEIREEAEERRIIAMEKSQKARLRTTAAPRSPIKLLIEMNEKGASFYHKRKKISFEQAIQLTKTSKKELSIDARIKNGIAKVVLR